MNSKMSVVTTNQNARYIFCVHEIPNLQLFYQNAHSRYISDTTFHKFYIIAK